MAILNTTNKTILIKWWIQYLYFNKKNVADVIKINIKLSCKYNSTYDSSSFSKEKVLNKEVIIRPF